MSNNTKAIATFAVGALLKILSLLFPNVEVLSSQALVDTLVVITVFVAGLFLKAPAEKKS